MYVTITREEIKTLPFDKMEKFLAIVDLLENRLNYLENNDTTANVFLERIAFLFLVKQFLIELKIPNKILFSIPNYEERPLHKSAAGDQDLV